MTRIKTRLMRSGRPLPNPLRDCGPDSLPDSPPTLCGWRRLCRGYFGGYFGTHGSLASVKLNPAMSFLLEII